MALLLLKFSLSCRKPLTLFHTWWGWFFDSSCQVFVCLCLFVLVFLGKGQVPGGPFSTNLLTSLQGRVLYPSHNSYCSFFLGLHCNRHLHKTLQSFFWWSLWRNSSKKVWSSPISVALKGFTLLPVYTWPLPLNHPSWGFPVVSPPDDLVLMFHDNICSLDFGLTLTWPQLSNGFKKSHELKLDILLVVVL